MLGLEQEDTFFLRLFSNNLDEGAYYKPISTKIFRVLFLRHFFFKFFFVYENFAIELNLLRFSHKTCYKIDYLPPKDFFDIS